MFFSPFCLFSIQYWSIKSLLVYSFPLFAIDITRISSYELCMRLQIVEGARNRLWQNSIKAAENSNFQARRHIHFTCKLRAEMEKAASIALVCVLFLFSAHSECNEEMDHKSADVYIIPPHEKNLFTPKQTVENAVS